MSTLHDQHIALLESVNKAKTVQEHTYQQAMLHGFRKGAEAAGRPLDLCACDLFYMDQGIDRPMCCGIWLDWEPSE